MARKKSQLPPEVRQFLSEIGRKGGAAGKGKAKARDPEKMRAAARRRWKNRKDKPAD